MKRLTLIFALLSFVLTGFAQSLLSPEQLAKREKRKNLTVKEWNTDAKSKTRWLDHVTTYNDRGEKVEEIEYTQYGQKWRETFEYDSNGLIVKDTRYNEKDKVELVRRYEYNADGTKKKQYNYAPTGKLLTIKVFEYERSIR